MLWQLTYFHNSRIFRLQVENIKDPNYNKRQFDLQYKVCFPSGYSIMCNSELSSHGNPYCHKMFLFPSFTDLINGHWKLMMLAGSEGPMKGLFVREAFQVFGAVRYLHRSCL